MRVPKNNIVEILREREEKGEDDLLYKLSMFIADRLDRLNFPDLDEQGLRVIGTQAIYDLQKGVDGFTGQPIDERNSYGLTGRPFFIYPYLAEYVLPVILDLVYSRNDS